MYQHILYINFISVINNSLTQLNVFIPRPNGWSLAIINFSMPDIRQTMPDS